MHCKQCIFFDLLGADYVDTEFYRHAGNCKNPKVCNQYDLGNANGDCFVRAGGFEGYGDYFHVHENFGCVEFKAK